MSGDLGPIRYLIPLFAFPANVGYGAGADRGLAALRGVWGWVPEARATEFAEASVFFPSN